MKYYLVYGCLLVESDLNIDFIKNYYRTDTVILIDKKKYDLILNDFLQYANKIKKIILSK